AFTHQAIIQQLIFLNQIITNWNQKTLFCIIESWRLLDKLVMNYLPLVKGVPVFQFVEISLLPSQFHSQKTIILGLNNEQLHRLTQFISSEIAANNSYRFKRIPHAIESFSSIRKYQLSNLKPPLLSKLNYWRYKKQVINQLRKKYLPGVQAVFSEGITQSISDWWETFQIPVIHYFSTNRTGLLAISELNYRVPGSCGKLIDELQYSLKNGSLIIGNEKLGLQDRQEGFLSVKGAWVPTQFWKGSSVTWMSVDKFVTIEKRQLFLQAESSTQENS
ncbi:MAG: hypothetical protein NZ108_10510, partial [Bacteroidia bacterium]|nr:hypothetical protein [Bacteroidia bacterium]